MGLKLEPKERVALAEAASEEKRVRRWRRMRAIELLAEGRSPEEAAAALGCARSSVYAWAKAWREMGLSGLGEGSRPGRKRSLEGRAENCFWKNSWKRVIHKRGATTRVVGRSLC